MTVVPQHKTSPAARFVWALDHKILAVERLVHAHNGVCEELHKIIKYVITSQITLEKPERDVKDFSTVEKSQNVFTQLQVGRESIFEWFLFWASSSGDSDSFQSRLSIPTCEMYHCSEITALTQQCVFQLCAALAATIQKVKVSVDLGPLQLFNYAIAIRFNY